MTRRQGDHAFVREREAGALDTYVDVVLIDRCLEPGTPGWRWRARVSHSRHEEVVLSESQLERAYRPRRAEVAPHGAATPEARPSPSDLDLRRLVDTVQSLWAANGKLNQAGLQVELHQTEAWANATLSRVAEACACRGDATLPKRRGHFYYARHQCDWAVHGAASVPIGPQRRALLSTLWTTMTLDVRRALGCTPSRT